MCSVFKVYCTVNNKEKHGIEAFLCLPCGTRVLSVPCPDSSRNDPAAWAQPPQARVRKEEEKQLHSCCPGCPGVKRAYLCVFGGEPLRGCVCTVRASSSLSAWGQACASLCILLFSRVMNDVSAQTGGPLKARWLTAA